jgi:dipeptidyl aminopeptidase
LTHSTLRIHAAISVAATLPPNLDTTGRHKYPVLLRPYGGPNSQTVQNKFKIDWSHYLASEGYIVLEIDGRGTGFQGRKFRSCIRSNLGELEAMDQIAVAEWYRDNHAFVDPKRIGIQGWSYGG